MATNKSKKNSKSKVKPASKKMVAKKTKAAKAGPAKSAKVMSSKSTSAKTKKGVSAKAKLTSAKSKKTLNEKKKKPVVAAPKIQKAKKEVLASKHFQAVKNPKAKAFLAPKIKKVQPDTPWEDFFTPLDDRLVVICEETTEASPSGLYIPDSVKDKPTKGTVLAVGRGHLSKKGKVRPLDVQRGDQVLFSEFSVNPVKMNGMEVLILRESEILGVVN